MAVQTLAQKFQMKPGSHILIVNTPDHFMALLADRPENTALVTRQEEAANGAFDFVLLFVGSLAELKRGAADAVAALRPGGNFWVAYPKRRGLIKTDIHRDSDWSVIQNLGFGPVRQIAIDETWSALRFRPEAEIKRKPDSVFSQT